MNHTTTLPYEELFSFLAKATAWLNKSKHNEHTKLGYAVSRVTPRVQKALEKAQRKHQNKIEQIKIDLCEVDEKGTVQKDDQGNFNYTRAKLKELRQKESDLLETLLEAEIEFKPYLATEIPETLFNYPLAFKVGMDPLTGAETEAFIGVVLETPIEMTEEADQPEDAVAVS